MLKKSNPLRAAAAPAAAPPRNFLAVAGLVAAAVGLALLPWLETPYGAVVLAATGLLCGLWGLFLPARRMAVATVVVSSLTLAAASGWGWLHRGASRQTRDQRAQAQAAIERYVDRLCVRIAEDNAILDKQSGREAIADWRDPWGRPLLYKTLDQQHFELRSAGPDAVLFSADDLAATSGLAEAPQRAQRAIAAVTAAPASPIQAAATSPAASPPTVNVGKNASPRPDTVEPESAFADPVAERPAASASNQTSSRSPKSEAPSAANPSSDTASKPKDRPGRKRRARRAD